MPYYLGIDGGGTKTTCAVGDEEHLLATATAGPSNIVRVGESQARQSLQQSVRQACAAAGITPAQVSHTCVGGSGAARPELAEIVRQSLAEIIATPVDVVGDMHIALEAAFDSGPGVIVIAGTGSIAYGRDKQGTTARAGGWGFAIGDEGSAHWIGRAAVGAVLRASDPTYGTAESILHGKFVTALCKAWGVTSLNDLARAANSCPPPDFAALFPVVAASQDVLALQVLSNAGRELAQIAVVVVNRLFSKDEGGPVPVAITGGVFRHAVLTRGDFYNELRQLDSRVEINTRIVEPVEELSAWREERDVRGAVMNSVTQNSIESSIAPESASSQAFPNLEAPGGLTADLALAALKNRSLASEVIEQISRNVALIKSRKVRIALAAHPCASRRIALRLIRELYTFDLMQFALLPAVAADLKRVADELLLGRLASITLGERIALARRSSGSVAAALLLDRETRVWQTALENSRLAEAGIVKALLRPSATPAFVKTVCHHARWSVRPEVRMALLRNEYTPLARALEFARRLPPAQLRDLLHSSRLPEKIKTYLRKDLQMRK